ncbi:MAG: hypothetical protein NTW37_05980 [Proteobacteria bacterium]|nr:hypothetical protein [Pseudomonadota bacterium]
MNTSAPNCCNCLPHRRGQVAPGQARRTNGHACEIEHALAGQGDQIDRVGQHPPGLRFLRGGLVFRRSGGLAARRCSRREPREQRALLGAQIDPGRQAPAPGAPQQHRAQAVEPRQFAQVPSGLRVARDQPAEIRRDLPLARGQRPEVPSPAQAHRDRLPRVRCLHSPGGSPVPLLDLTDARHHRRLSVLPTPRSCHPRAVWLSGSTANSLGGDWRTAKKRIGELGSSLEKANWGQVLSLASAKRIELVELGSSLEFCIGAMTAQPRVPQ